MGNSKLLLVKWQVGNLSFYNRVTIAAPTGIFFYRLLIYRKLQSKDLRIKVGAGGDIF